jgi:hypothetical protein
MSTKEEQEAMVEALQKELNTTEVDLASDSEAPDPKKVKKTI